jgi:hypothetical protein
MTSPDPPAAALLAQIRERQALASDAGLGFSRMNERHEAMIKVTYEDTPRLVAAVERVLKHHRKTTIYETSVYAHDQADVPRVHCGHTYEETENGRHVMADDDSIICLDKPVADVCDSCRDECGESEDWPCAEYRAITAALAGTQLEEQ